jgi:pyruvate-formate lyase-activating enzyme
MSELVNKVALLAMQISDPTLTGVVVTGGDPLLKAEQIITLIRDQIAKEIYATCQCHTLSSGWHCQADEMAAMVLGVVY